MKDLGQLHHFLGISVQHQPTGIFLSQRQYTMEIIEREGLVDYKPCTTPVNTLSKLSGYTGDPVSDPTHYSSLVGALQYLTFTRPNLSYVVQQVCLHMHDLRETHMIALRHILRYLQSTLDFGLLHRSSISDLVVYSNADWVGAPTITGPLLGMQSFLVTTSSLGLPSIRTRGISLQCRSRIPGCCQWCRGDFFSSQVTHGAALSSDPQHTCLLRQCQCRLLAVQPDSVSAHLSIARSMLRLISTSSVSKSSLRKFMFCTSRQLLSSSTYSLRVCHLHASSFAPVSIFIVTRVGTARGGRGVVRSVVL
jgi:hypothetical protein